MFTPINLIRVALLLVSIGLCVLYFYAPIFWTHGNWYDPWLGFDESVGRELLLVCAIPGFVASLFLYFSELAWKRILSLAAQSCLNLCWCWNLVESWIDGRTLIQNGAWAEGGQGWDYLTLAGAVVCLSGAVYVIRADYLGSRWKSHTYGLKPLPGAKPKKEGKRYNAHARSLQEDEPPTRIEM